MRMLAGIVVALVIVIGAILIGMVILEQDECQKKGGEMVGTGKYTTTYIKSGQINVPITTEIQACTK